MFGEIHPRLLYSWSNEEQRVEQMGQVICRTLCKKLQLCYVVSSSKQSILQMRKWVTEKPRQSSKLEVEPGPESRLPSSGARVRNHCPTAVSAQGRRKRQGKGGKQSLVCRRKQGSRPKSVYILFRCLVLWVFCMNCSSRTLFSGDQLSQSRQMCWEVFFF